MTGFLALACCFKVANLIFIRRKCSFLVNRPFRSPRAAVAFAWPEFLPKAVCRWSAKMGLASAVLWGFSGILVTETTLSFGAFYDGIIGVGVPADFPIVIAATPGDRSWCACYALSGWAHGPGSDLAHGGSDMVCSGAGRGRCIPRIPGYHFRRLG